MGAAAGKKKKSPAVPWGTSEAVSGEPWSKLLPSDVEERIRSVVSNAITPLPKATQQVALQIMAEMTTVSPDQLEAEVVKTDWTKGKEPVSPEEFLDDPYYLGEWGKTIYPCWRHDLTYVLDPQRRIEEWALVGAQGTGKTTAAIAAQIYKFYRLSKLKNPQRFYDLDAVSRIYFGLFSLNMTKSKSVLYEKFLAVINQSPYFRDHLPSRHKRGGLTVAKGLASTEQEADAVSNIELIFPQGLRVVSGSLTGHAISIDLMSAVLDEMNWRRKKTVRPEEDANSALALYEQIRTRIKGRFLMKHQTSPGLLCSISSKRATTDFMDGLVARMRGEPNRCYISDYALWDAKPGAKFSGEKFYCFVGGSYGQSRIIPDEELVGMDLTTNNIIAVPVEFREDFAMNLDTALRDIAGISTVPYTLLFESDAHIRQVEDLTRRAPFRMDEVPLGVNSPHTLSDFFDQNVCIRFDGMNHKPMMYPNAPRYVHVDLSKVKDATGIAMLCPSDVRAIKSKTAEGKEAVAYVPNVYVDFVLRIKAPKSDQIDYDKIRQFIVHLRRLGYRIACVSFDQYQSTDSMQMLNKMQFHTAYLSVDKTDNPYIALRQAYMQKRINVYHYMPLVTELRQLIHDHETQKVDHPEVDANGGPGSKDVADALTGAYWSLMQAVAAVKPSQRSPTTVDVARLAAVSNEAEPTDKVKQFFEKLKALDNPNSIATADWQAENNVVEVDTTRRGPTRK